MNAFDYFFENTSNLGKLFLAGKEEITYKELYRSCLNLAGWIEKKIGQNKNIFILSVNNLFLLKAYLAVIKSGNVCIPLDPNIEKENYRYIANLTKPELIFLTHDIDRRLELNKNGSVFPDTLPELSADNSETAKFSQDFDRERCAEIIFTSGSTGKPKGVMVSHKNLISNTGSIVEYLKLTQDDRMLVVLPFYYCWTFTASYTSESGWINCIQ